LKSSQGLLEKSRAKNRILQGSSTKQYQQHVPTTGVRRRHFLHTYAGKDLLIQMEHDLKSLGFNNFAEFRERILLGIQRTTEDINLWLPEWNALRTEVQSYVP